MDISVIITAGGTGKRMRGDIPKQFMEVAGKPILFHTIALFHSFNNSAQIIVTLPESWLSYWEELINTYQFDVPHEVIAGGQERFHSIKNALQSCNEPIVMVHDGVRPLVSSETLQRCVDALENYNAVIPVVPVKESLRKVFGKKSEALIRSEYRIVQTPQCFEKSVLEQAYAQDYHDGITDDASLVEQNGEYIHLVEGNDENIKITTPMDLLLAESLLK
ncbi:MAG: 2-C-methyl-D-erythritol 4-phosphate cytidylyltransferase [bacterium]|nr:2-C-methyl-D-erythritol 4-phosphate cytidylyltransferase [bacterium]